MRRVIGSIVLLLLAAGPLVAAQAPGPVATSFAGSVKEAIGDAVIVVRLETEERALCQIRDALVGGIGSHQTGLLLEYWETPDASGGTGYFSGTTLENFNQAHAGDLFDSRQLFAHDGYLAVASSGGIYVDGWLEITVAGLDLRPIPEEHWVDLGGITMGEAAFEFQAECDAPVTVTVQGAREALVFNHHTLEGGVGASNFFFTYVAAIDGAEGTFTAPVRAWIDSGGIEAGLLRLDSPDGAADHMMGADHLRIREEGPAGDWSMQVTAAGPIASIHGFMAGLRPVDDLQDVASLPDLPSG